MLHQLTVKKQNIVTYHLWSQLLFIYPNQQTQEVNSV